MQEGHTPVMPVEVLEALAPAPGSLQIDATLGGGGHTERILEATRPDGRLLGLDADGAAIAQEIVTKPGAVDVSSEVAKLRRAKPDFVIFHGYVLAPIPEFIKQMRESGMSATPMGTIWSMDKTTVDAMGAAGQGWMGVMPYRYSYDTKDAPTMQVIKDTTD